MKYFVFFLTFMFMIVEALFIKQLPILAVNKVLSQQVQPKKNLSGPNLASCLARQSAIKNQMTSLVNLSTKTEKELAVLAQRTVDYYNSTVVPSGKTVTNYNILITNIQTGEDTVLAALNTAQTDSNNFVCSEGDPKLFMAQYRLNMQTVKRSLRDYKSSIKNLIMAVRAVSPASVNTQ